MCFTLLTFNAGRRLFGAVADHGSLTGGGFRETKKTLGAMASHSAVYRPFVGAVLQSPRSHDFRLSVLLLVSVGVGPDHRVSHVSRLSERSP